MKIEEVIHQQRPFRNPWQKSVINLIYTANWVSDQIREMLKPYGITQQQYNVLRILRGAGEPISTSVIRERLLDKMADTSRMVDRLYQKGLVDRRVCASDKRLVDVSLTDKGTVLIEELDHLNTQIDQVISSLSHEEAELLSNLLDKARG